MSLAGGDLTTPQRVSNWLPNPPTLPSTIISQLIGSMTGLLYGKLNRARTYNQTFTRTFDGVGNAQIVLPDYPVTSVTSVYNGQALIPPRVLVPQGTVLPQGSSPCYGWSVPYWAGNLPGENATLDFIGGYFWGAQAVKVTYQAGYLISAETQTVPSTPYEITVNQFEGIWCRDNGVAYATSGALLTPVAASPTTGQYIPPADASPGLYTFSAGDVNANLLLSYSFIPAPLEEACIQMVAERSSYRTRVGDISKSLGGQETVRFMRGNSGSPWNKSGSLPPEVMDLIEPYISVVYPNIGTPL